MLECRAFLLAGTVAAIAFPRALPAQRSGAQTWADNCGNCHVQQPPQRYTAERWAIIMRHMQINARLTDAETEAVLEFLQAGARQPASAEARQAEPVRVALADPALIPLVTTSPNGAEIFERQCVACHGKEGKGNGPAAPALDPRPSDLTDGESISRLTDDELRRIIADGTGSMPGFDSMLEPNELEAVVRYVRGLAAGAGS